MARSAAKRRRSPRSQEGGVTQREKKPPVASSIFVFAAAGFAVLRLLTQGSGFCGGAEAEGAVSDQFAPCQARGETAGCLALGNGNASQPSRLPMAHSEDKALLSTP